MPPPWRPTRVHRAAVQTSASGTCRNPWTRRVRRIALPRYSPNVLQLQTSDGPKSEVQGLTSRVRVMPAAMSFLEKRGRSDPVSHGRGRNPLAVEPIRVVGFVAERTLVACPADRKIFPFRKWNLAFQRLQNHHLIMTISFMTTSWEEQQPISYASRLAAAHRGRAWATTRPNNGNDHRTLTFTGLVTTGNTS
jgi:hypothetical protein